MQWTKYFRQKKNSVGIPKHSKREKTNGVILGKCKKITKKEQTETATERAI